ncbi:MAG: hypothetical protein JWQ80_2549 [Massilia sp.]|nr:hypothetical protein [Massilia sp.]
MGIASECMAAIDTAAITRDSVAAPTLTLALTIPASSSDSTRGLKTMPPNQLMFFGPAPIPNVAASSGE